MRTGIKRPTKIVKAVLKSGNSNLINVLAKFPECLDMFMKDKSGVLMTCYCDKAMRRTY